MNPNHYHSMTDEQLAEWATLSARVHRLTSELSEEKDKRTAAEEKTVAEQRARIREVQQAGAAVVEARQKLNEQVSMTRRANGQLLEALRSIDVLLKALAASNMDQARYYFPGEVYRAMQDAREVLKAYGIPF